ncbi:DUF3306 domain-containing protein [Azospirillum cavernae]|uniref:DUF3306 domain-containing protein n=1 Tax=Azospirillum cavernae TaxID=2320860 RepID=A0A418W319_9PROT|nr:DUF3306 domain-containing protein [Azospirillum cavernae]RJF84425.1 DUF3306 domain-containing protein [Azospirillum cavernae]
MSDEAFLSRWSRLKRASATPPDPAPPTTEPPVAAAAPEGAAFVETDGDAPPPSVDEAADPLADLPSVEDLTAESDFTPFLRADVPEDLHRQALRKLWTSDPVYANDDGLKDYADDYTGLFNLSEPVKTLYRVGRGFLTDDPESPSPPGERVGVRGRRCRMFLRKLTACLRRPTRCLRRSRLRSPTLSSPPIPLTPPLSALGIILGRGRTRRRPNPEAKRRIPSRPLQRKGRSDSASIALSERVVWTTFPPCPLLTKRLAGLSY